mgnify:CR=1 FL=1
MENCYVGMAGPFHSKYRASSCVKVPSLDENSGLLGSLLAITDDLASLCELLGYGLGDSRGLSSKL